MPDQTASFDKKLYSPECIKKSLYRLADKAGFELSENDDSYLVHIFTNDTDEDVKLLLNQLRNEVIDQNLREIVASDTKSIRELILANAFNNTKMVDAS